MVDQVGIDAEIARGAKCQHARYGIGAISPRCKVPGSVESQAARAVNLQTRNEVGSQQTLRSESDEKIARIVWPSHQCS